MRDVSRHKSMDVLPAYVRDVDLSRDDADTGLLQARRDARQFGRTSAPMRPHFVHAINERL